MFCILDHPLMPLVHETVNPLLHDVGPTPLDSSFYLIFHVKLPPSQPGFSLREEPKVCWGKMWIVRGVVEQLNVFGSDELYYPLADMGMCIILVKHPALFHLFWPFCLEMDQKP